MPIDQKMLKHGRVAKALSSECRLLLIDWLREPDRHFVNRRKYVGGRRSVAVPDIQAKWNVAKGTALKHVTLLAAAGLITLKKRNKVKWVARSERGIQIAREFGYIFVT